MKIFIQCLFTVALAIPLGLPVEAVADNDHSSVNKSIRLNDNTTAGDVDSVNGSIRIGSNSTVRSVESVNGSIVISNDVTIDGRVEAINGEINLQSGCKVGENVVTINGGIRLENTLVSGDVETINGQIRILDGSEISGNVVVREPKGWNWSKKRKPIRVEIGKDVQVNGDLIFEQPVVLKIHDSARVGDIIGDEVEMVGST
jgi:hypothetical protein